MYLWIHDKYSSTRFKQCEWQRKILQGYQFLFLNCALVAWPSGMRSRFLRWRKLGWRFISRGAISYVFFLFPSYFYHLACFCLFSLLLASRDFCDNVFLNILVSILLVTPIQLSRFKSKVTKGPWVHAVSLDSFSHTGNNFTNRLVLHIFREFLLIQSTPDYSNPR